MDIKDACIGIILGNYILNMKPGIMYRLDFIYPSNNIVPDGSWVNMPGEAVNNIYIRNDGPDTIIFSINEPNNKNISGPVLTKTFTKEITFKEKMIKSINLFIYGNGTSASVSVDVGM